ncbi:MAG: CDP-diacylglycerol--glycerol-3-phosphate 3-phosphatidyltransferase [Clostridia bacterium]
MNNETTKVEEEKEIANKIENKKEKVKINLPNKLTILRMILVPVFVLLMALDAYLPGAGLTIGKIAVTLPWLKYVTCLVFVFAALTDFVDGYLSRKNNEVTTFGKIMDPLADKLLVSAGFIMLTGMGKIPALITAIVIIRDFLINGFRMFGTAKDAVIPAAWSGKVKTASQLAGLTLTILDKNAFGAFLSGNLYGLDIILNVSATVFITIALLATIYSAVDYTIKLKKYIDPTK